MWPIAGPRVLFDARLLGGNAPTFDYIVYLVDAKGDRTGAFFFVQVKTTATAPKPGAAYPIAFGATDVKRAQRTKIPFFVSVVDTSDPHRPRFFIKGVDSKRSTGMARLAQDYDLATDAVKLDLYDEVTRLWGTQRTPALAKFI
jgi:hypothetical protein